VIGLASRANRDVLDVMRLLSTRVRGWLSRSVPMLMSVEETTPVLLKGGLVELEWSGDTAYINLLVAKQ